MQPTTATSIAHAAQPKPSSAIVTTSSENAATTFTIARCASRRWVARACCPGRRRAAGGVRIDQAQLIIGHCIQVDRRASPFERARQTSEQDRRPLAGVSCEPCEIRRLGIRLEVSFDAQFFAQFDITAILMRSGNKKPSDLEGFL
jgi:hypothetical protein